MKKRKIIEDKFSNIYLVYDQIYKISKHKVLKNTRSNFAKA